MKLRRGVFRRRERKMPGLNTAALPDLIFTVLFFFMIVTHMRDVELLVHYDVPQGTEVQKMGHKSAVAYIYVGRLSSFNPQSSNLKSQPSNLNSQTSNLNPQSSNLNSQISNLNPQINKDTFCIQLNNRIATVADIRKFVEEERERMSAEDRSRMVVSLKADRDVPMSLIAEIKEALQHSFALRINYAATEKKSSK